METTEVIIARLVLGYLKEEKCRTAYKEFLKTSHHLKSDLTRSKYLPTRFIGLTLEDILNEYFEVSKIVQGRLEATNYYDEHHLKTSLVQQLLYLLNRTQLSRTSTPCPRSPVESHLDESSPSHIDHISDVETTPTHTLPGNAHCASEGALYKTYKRKSNSKLSKSFTESTLEIVEKDDMSEVLAHTLLENKEFHEKIAQTINKVAEKQCRVSSELDRTIRTVVEETEADPIFDKILEEIIGSTTENCQGVETCSTSSSAKEKVEEVGNKSKTTPNHLNSDESLDDIDQNFTHNNAQTVDQQNDEAVRSIVENSKLKGNSQGNEQLTQANNESMVVGGTSDKSSVSNAISNANTQMYYAAPIFFAATGSYLMFPSSVASNGNLKIGKSKLTKKQAVNWNVPIVQNTAISEQSIFSMPVILNDVNQNKTVATQQLLQIPKSTQSSALPRVAPKPIIEISPDYLESISEPNIPEQKGLKRVIYPKTSRKQKIDEKAVDNTFEIRINEIQSSIPKKSIPDNLLEIDTVVDKAKKSLPNDLLEIDTAVDKEPSTESESIVQANVKDSNESVTPSPIERVQKTPKSGSHVRNLKFSTPTTAYKKSCESKSPTFVHKKQAAKFLSDSQESASKGKAQASRDIKKPKNQEPADGKTWDSDLRAAVLPLPEVKEEEAKDIVSSKKRKKTPVESTRKKGKRKKIKKCLNNTEQDAAIIEAALQTPAKSIEKFENQGRVDEGEIESDEFNDNTDREKEKSNSKNKFDKNKDQLSECLNKDCDGSEINKTVLSPSKLNGNKHKLINSDITNDANESDVCAPEKSVDEISKFVTPEMSRENFHYPIKANRNITALFETPLKDDRLPRTPGADCLNISSNTPFSEMLKANLNVMDNNYCIPTPNIPITPNFPPFTPNVEGMTPYSNRPTDYSNSDSYYQPSDSEPNRSVEVNVLELEKRPLNTKEKVDISKENKAEITKTENDTVKFVNPVIDERLKIFNGNIIGKKNLSLVKRNLSTDSSSSDSSSESSSEEEDVSFSSSIEKSNETVICDKKCTETPKRVYSLRNRTARKKEIITTSEVEVLTKSKPTSSKRKKSNVRQIDNSINKQVTTEPQKCLEENESPIHEYQKESIISTNTVKTTGLQKAELQKVLNEKRSRTINKIKNDEKPKSKENRSFMKIKFVSNAKNKKKAKLENMKRTLQKRASNKKDNANSENCSSPRKSKNDNKKVTFRQTLKDTEKDKSASDIEAQNLIEGLKERGILLMKNKPSPVKKTNENSTFSELNKDSNVEKDPSKDDNGAEEGQLERSTSELETEWREIYDTKSIEGEHECVVFGESKKITKRSIKVYDMEALEKKFVAKVFIEEINSEVDIPLIVSPFYTLLDIQSTKSPLQKPSTTKYKIKYDKKSQEKPSNPELIMSKINKNNTNPILDDHTISKCPSEDKEGLDTPSGKKRKIDKEECRVPEEKECKSLLQQINVDTFLNNIYGKK